MLEEKTYSISELAAIIGGSSDRQAIKRKLERRAAWALADAHNQMSLDYARQLDAKEAVTNIKISSEVKIKK